MSIEGASWHIVGPPPLGGGVSRGVAPDLGTPLWPLVARGGRSAFARVRRRPSEVSVLGEESS